MMVKSGPHQGDDGYQASSYLQLDIAPQWVCLCEEAGGQLDEDKLSHHCCSTCHQVCSCEEVELEASPVKDNSWQNRYLYSGQCGSWHATVGSAEACTAGNTEAGTVGSAEAWVV